MLSSITYETVKRKEIWQGKSLQTSIILCKVFGKTAWIHVYSPVLEYTSTMAIFDNRKIFYYINLKTYWKSPKVIQESLRTLTCLKSTLKTSEKMCEICLIETPYWRQYGIFIVNFQRISHLFLVFIFNFEQVNVCCDCTFQTKTLYLQRKPMEEQAQQQQQITNNWVLIPFNSNNPWWTQWAILFGRFVIITFIKISIFRKLKLEYVFDNNGKLYISDHSYPKSFSRSWNWQHTP